MRQLSNDTRELCRNHAGSCKRRLNSARQPPAFSCHHQVAPYWSKRQPAGSCFGLSYDTGSTASPAQCTSYLQRKRCLSHFDANRSIKLSIAGHKVWISCWEQEKFILLTESACIFVKCAMASSHVLSASLTRPSCSISAACFSKQQACSLYFSWAQNPSAASK